jgi:hypothetical protein
LQIAQIRQIFDKAITQPFDIHRAARSEVADRFLALRGT